MAKIQILNNTLASQVAAGEVVERPASVVKELVENSIDAQARHITVEIQRGGTALVRVTDDGCGMSREDALLSLERHATSKLKDSAGLSTILTLGFRGEAVPSIASVSRFRLATRERGGEVGYEVLVDGGTIVDVREAGVPEGTCIEAKQLFYNIPARRKFLRAETTEAAHVEHQVRMHALATPRVRFTMIKEGKTLFDLAGTSDWRVRISGLAGSEVANRLIEVKSMSMPGMAVRGYLLPAEYARKGKRQQFVFLNGRPIEDPAISRALKDGYRGAIQEGANPAAWLWIDMDPELVDVNVHPAKREVRFHRPHEIRNLIAEAVTEALNPTRETNPVERGGVSRGGSSSEEIEHVSSFNSSDGENVSSAGDSDNLVDDFSSGEDTSLPLTEPSGQQTVELPYHREEQAELTDEKGKTLVERPDFRVIGELHDTYFLLEGEEGLVLLDPVAARERVVYEELLKSGKEGGIRTQGLLIPELLELDVLDAELVLRHASHFEEAGMTLESFGGSTVKISSIPAFLELSDVHGFLMGLVDELHETVGTRRGKAVAYETFAAGIARRAGKVEVCKPGQAEALLTAMFRCDLPYCTPDGRPTLIHISLNELARKFGR